MNRKFITSDIYVSEMNVTVFSVEKSYVPGAEFMQPRVRQFIAVLLAGKKAEISSDDHLATLTYLVCLINYIIGPTRSAWFTWEMFRMRCTTHHTTIRPSDEPMRPRRCWRSDRIRKPNQAEEISWFKFSLLFFSCLILCFDILLIWMRNCIQYDPNGRADPFHLMTFIRCTCRTIFSFSPSHSDQASKSGHENSPWSVQSGRRCDAMCPCAPRCANHVAMHRLNRISYANYLNKSINVHIYFQILAILQ